MIQRFQFMADARHRRNYIRRTGILAVTLGTPLIASFIGAAIIACLNRGGIEWCAAILAGLILAQGLFTATGGVLVTVADIEVSDSQLCHEVVGGKSYVIDFSDLEQARVTKTYLQLPYVSPHSHLVGKSEVYLVEIPKGSPWHWLAGIYYRQGIKPILVITQDHHNHDELISIIIKIAGKDVVED